MVSASAGPLTCLLQGLRDDVGGLVLRLQALLRPAVSQPGLFTYRVDHTEGKLRLHLRLHADGSGLLFINATETIHLPSTAAEMVKLVLEEVPIEHALAQLRLSYPTVHSGSLAAELHRMAETVAKLKRPTEGCRLCALGLEQPPPFSVRAQAPYKADLALHYACNNNCAHCYNEPGRKTMPSMSSEKWQRVLRKLFDVGVPYIIFTGGEPTLHPDLVELVAYAESLGQLTGLNTNGRRLIDPTLTAALQAAGLDHVQITLNSHHRELHNQIVGAEAFDETIAGLRCALDAGLHTLTNTTLVESNAGQALDLVDFLHDLGVRTFAMNSMIYSGCGACYPGALRAERLETVLPQVRERAQEYGMHFLWYTPTEYCRLSPLELGLGIRCCNAAEYSICIEPNGDVLPCQSYYVPAGNILTDRWEDIWNSELFRKFRYRREHPEESGLPEKCGDCELLPICGGGCALERQAHQTEVINK